MANVTIYEVAEEAGVSIATVSKVLSNTPHVSDATRVKVLRTIERLGYVPNPAARSLTKGRTSIVGLVIPYAPTQLFADPHLLEIIHGVEEMINEQDYNLLLATARRAHDPASAYARLLRSRYLDGAIILDASAGDAVSRQLSQQRYPWVVIGYPLGAEPRCAIHTDDFEAACRMTEHLLGLGHVRIGLLAAGPPPFALSERVRGYRHALQQHGVPFDPRLVVSGDLTIESGYAAAPQLLLQEARPTAIFALNDRMALGVLRWAQEQGLHVPGDLSVVGFDDIPMASLAFPPLTTIRQLAVSLGQEATRLLFLLLAGEQAPQRTVIPSELVVRASSGPPPAHTATTR